MGRSATLVNCRNRDAQPIVKTCTFRLAKVRLKRYARQMATPTLHELLAAIRSLPLEERLQLIERATREAAEDTPTPPAAWVATTSSPALLGLMADEPDLIDRMCDMAYQARSTARMRIIDE